MKPFLRYVHEINDFGPKFLKEIPPLTPQTVSDLSTLTDLALSFETTAENAGQPRIVQKYK